MTNRTDQPRRLAELFGSPRLVDAFAFTLESHATQLRRGSAIPYVAHPLAVASIVLELGGDEDEAIAALLHDVVEDCGVSPQVAELADLVEAFAVSRETTH